MGRQIQIASHFIEACARGEVRAAFAEHVGPGFRHHNPYFRGDAESLMEAMIEADRTQPNRKFTIKQVYETEDRVALFSKVEKETLEIAVVHLMRFEHGKIVELWDVGQRLEPNSPNENGMF